MSGPDDAKRGLRRELLAVRSRLTGDDAEKTAAVLARRVLSLPEMAGARTVAAYVSVGGEPGTKALLEELRRRGVRVLLPVLLPDDDLDWAEYEGPASLAETRRSGRMTLHEPAGPRLGPEAVTGVDAVLLPGLAADLSGRRLGRGGGSYDRVLARLAAAGADPLLLVLLHDHELREEVPAEPHDRPVHVVLTPSGTHRARGRG
ncbi:5-formyltetrahydrofolate cyclo-ligase [Streptomyces albidoflavus]|nr:MULTISPECIES: 5-formyltetrahydrofolate cyclo-ligase [Streptomyces]MBL0778909.1 5-formyltetrahydrofolate cyclo-ligase [Streptomyces albidoflavus]MBV1955570.1 5-formyltetrahydrofolate cyclo-ligase [Streptomyces sp. BV333]MCK2141563.1 5-formyltetrahydrofolate cyclo-ligase [Streptomyces sp. WAC00276]MCQ9707404.1 5-formyltetrahydrofolate cyclo-ligase [Streptomyces sp. BSP1]QDD59117.1 5-formyltetrahydrofolate cyclo-ligase [Streptomyces albidoflavus]